jgi:hypothetical protein
MQSKLLLKLHFQLASFLNYYSVLYIAVLFFIFKKLVSASELFLIISLTSIFTHGFSANLRNIYLGSRKLIDIKKIISIRLIIATVSSIISSILVIYFFNDEFILINFILILLIFTNWIQELIIARLEKKEVFSIIYFINQLFFFIFSTIFVYFDFILFLIFLILFYICVNILIFRNIFIEAIINIKSIKKKIFKKLNLNIGFLSTILKTSVNFYWRFIIIFFVGKETASFLFIGFMLGSFFGTLFDISYGSYFLKKIRNKNIFINSIFIIYVFIILIFLYIVKKYSNYNYEQFQILMKTTFYSIIGSYFMVAALHARQQLYELISYRRTCYKADIFIQIMNFVFVPIVYFLNKDFLTFSYLLSSIFFYLMYKAFDLNVIKKS